MSTQNEGPPAEGPADPWSQASDALAELASIVRGGGGAAGDAEGLATTFAEAVLTIAEGQTLVIDVTERGLMTSGRALWADDLLARRVTHALHGQRLRAVALRGDVDPRALRALAALLVRDWTQQDDGALETLLSERRIPGVELDFESAAPEAPAPSVGGGTTPAELLAALRSDAAAEHHVLGPLLARLAGTQEVSHEQRGLIQGAGMAARASVARDLEELRKGSDATHDDIGRVALEAIRLDPSGLQAMDTFRMVAGHARHELRAGAPTEALALVGRLLGLGAGEVDPDWPHRDLLGAELTAFASPALVEGLEDLVHDRHLDGWRALLFQLTSVVPEERLPAFVTEAGGCTTREVRQAVADALALRFPDPDILLGWLKEAAGPAAGVLLLALSRVDVAASLERMLARLDDKDPLVREAALVAVRRYRTPRTQEMVRAAMSDGEERVRVEALRYLCVYRDADAGPLVLERLRDAKPGQVSESELRALAMGLGIIARQEAVLPLTHLVQDTAREHPALARAAIAGLRSVGEGGKAAISGLSREDAAIAALVQQEVR